MTGLGEYFGFAWTTLDWKSFSYSHSIITILTSCCSTDLGGQEELPWGAKVGGVEDTVPLLYEALLWKHNKQLTYIYHILPNTVHSNLLLEISNLIQSQKKNSLYNYIKITEFSKHKYCNFERWESEKTVQSFFKVTMEVIKLLCFVFSRNRELVQKSFVISSSKIELRKTGGAYHVFRTANSSSSGACNWSCGNNTARNSGLGWWTAILWDIVEASWHWLTCTRWPVLLLKVHWMAKVKNKILFKWKWLALKPSFTLE